MASLAEVGAIALGLHLHFGGIVLLCSLCLCWCVPSILSSSKCELRELVET